MATESISNCISVDSDYAEKTYKAWAELGRSFFTGGFFPGGLAGGDQPLESWTKNFRGLYDKAMAFPPFPVAGGMTGQDPKAYGEYIDLAKAQAELYGNWASMMVDLSQAWVEGTTSASTKLSSTKFETPEVYRKHAYDLYIKELESKFDALLRDKKFASRLGNLLSSYLEVKQRRHRLIEGYLGLFNMPTRTEIDRVYKELHELKRTVRRLSRGSGGRGEDESDE
jgi:hypothetical protein